MAEPTKNHPRTLCVDLPTERDAMEVAKPIAEKLAERLQDRGGIVTVTDRARQRSWHGFCRSNRNTGEAAARY